MAVRSHGGAVVVGASGFLGAALSEALARAGVPVGTATRERPALLPDGSVRSDLRGASTWYWAASSINPLIAAEHPERVRADLRDFARFTDAVHAHGGGAQVVLLSSGGTVYGAAARPPHSELTVPVPTSEYGRAKLALEDMLHEHEIPSVVVRISNAYGPGQQPAPGQGVIGHWLRAVQAGSPITVIGDLATVRDYVYVDDVVDLLVRLHMAEAIPPTLNVGSGRPTTLAEVIDVITDVVGAGPLSVETTPRREFDIAASWLKIDLARASTGWSPRTSLRDGVAAMWAWLERDTTG